MSYSKSFTTKKTRGHIAFVYDNSDERMRLLADYFEDGRKHNELCVFVTPDTVPEIIEHFDTLGYRDLIGAVAEGSLRVFEMSETYLQDGKFVANYMLQNVTNFIEEAKSLGFSGLRTAGEMSWLHEYQDSSSEAFKYESDVNQLCAEDDSFMGLCLYPAQTAFGPLLRAVMQTHPSFMYDGSPKLSPYFALS